MTGRFDRFTKRILVAAVSSTIGGSEPVGKENLRMSAVQGAILCAVPVLHLTLLRRELAGPMFFAGRVAAAHCGSDSEARSRMFADLINSCVPALGLRKPGLHPPIARIESDGHVRWRFDDTSLLWAQSVRRRSQILKGTIGFVPILGMGIAGLYDWSICRKMLRRAS